MELLSVVLPLHRSLLGRNLQLHSDAQHNKSVLQRGLMQNRAIIMHATGHTAYNLDLSSIKSLFCLDFSLLFFAAWILALICDLMDIRDVTWSIPLPFRTRETHGNLISLTTCQKARSRPSCRRSSLHVKLHKTISSYDSSLGKLLQAQLCLCLDNYCIWTLNPLIIFDIALQTWAGPRLRSFPGITVFWCLVGWFKSCRPTYGRDSIISYEMSYRDIVQGSNYAGCASSYNHMSGASPNVLPSPLWRSGADLRYRELHIATQLSCTLFNNRFTDDPAC